VEQQSRNKKQATEKGTRRTLKKQSLATNSKNLAENSWNSFPQDFRWSWPQELRGL